MHCMHPWLDFCRIANEVVLHAWQRAWYNYTEPVTDAGLDSNAGTFSVRWGDVLFYADGSHGMIELRCA
jgi:hypothetical protein